MIKYKRFLFLFSFTFLIYNCSTLQAQSFNPDTTEYRYLVYFKDKGKFKPEDKIEPGSEAYITAKAQLTEKALKRREKVLPESEIISYNDLPVYDKYVEQIKASGLKINAVSKWFNAVSITTTTKKLDELKKLGFIIKFEGVHFLELVKIPSFHEVNYFKYDTVIYKNLKYNYGLSFWQNQQINIPILHYCGITGWGVTIGMNDDGFNWRHHEALKNRKVIDEHDWIFQDDSTVNQFPPNQFPEDRYDQDGHGTSTFSTIGGFYPGKLIGPAFDAEYYLSKTEDTRSETPVEEDYWLEGAEWMESQGIEVFSSSLIYKPFDKPNNYYTYSDMDGKTTTVVRAAENMVHLGVVVCNSMGNEHQTHPASIVSPADGDSVISVGAVDSVGYITDFSSNGPTSDGRKKPDVVAMGEDDWTAVSETLSENDSSYSYASGTSFSGPLTAGVCALILSVHPELTPMQVKEALKMTANNKEMPNNIYGWGLINAYDAALYYGMIMSNKPDITINDEEVTISTFALSKNIIDAEKVKLYYTYDENNDFKEIPMKLVEKLDDFNSGKYSTTIKLNFYLLKLYFSAEDSKQSIHSPYEAPDRFFLFNKENSQIQLY
jgi:serine protease AprX